MPSFASRVRLLLHDPLGFEYALTGFRVEPTDLPSLTRESRLTGAGC